MFGLAGPTFCRSKTSSALLAPRSPAQSGEEHNKALPKVQQGQSRALACPTTLQGLCIVVIDSLVAQPWSCATQHLSQQTLLESQQKHGEHFSRGIPDWLHKHQPRSTWATLTAGYTQ